LWWLIWRDVFPNPIFCHSFECVWVFGFPHLNRQHIEQLTIQYKYNKFRKFVSLPWKLDNQYYQYTHKFLNIGFLFLGYRMLKHNKDKANPDRFKYLYSGAKRIDKDGYNSLKYKPVKIVPKRLFTWILVDLPHLTLWSEKNKLFFFLFFFPLNS